MCGRFTLRNPRRVRIERVRVGGLFNNAPRYNIAPSQSVLAIVEGEVEREAALFQWGPIPSWSKEPKGFINARSETLEEKPSFSESFHRRRCLIPADGFFEWDKRSRRSKQPYYFHMNDEAPFALAGIWDEWRKDELSITSCAIITTTPNELLAPIHDRMPVILREEDQNSWLRSDARPAELKTLLAPFSATEMKSFPVSSRVNHPRFDDSDLVEPTDPDMQIPRMLFEL